MVRLSLHAASRAPAKTGVAAAFLALTLTGCSFFDDDDDGAATPDPVASITAASALKTATVSSYGANQSVTVAGESYTFSNPSASGTTLTNTASGDDTVSLHARYGTNVNMLSLARYGGADASNDFVAVHMDTGSGPSASIPTSGTAIYRTQLMRQGYDTSTRGSAGFVSTVMDLEADFGAAKSLTCDASCGSWTFNGAIQTDGSVTGTLNDGTTDFTIDNGGFYGTTGTATGLLGEVAGTFTGTAGNTAYAGFFHGKEPD